MTEKKPEFREINSFEEFNKYYWYHKELSQICKALKIKSKGTKQELINIIKEYFDGNYINGSRPRGKIKLTADITTNTPLLECAFSFNTKFREYFSALTGVSPFKFTADMAAAWRKVKEERDISNLQFRICWTSIMENRIMPGMTTLHASGINFLRTFVQIQLAQNIMTS